MHGVTRQSGSLGGRRVAQITFVLFDKANGRVETKGVRTSAQQHDPIQYLYIFFAAIR
jgi:hypothetical protein